MNQSPAFREDEGRQAIRAIAAYLKGANEVLRKERGYNKGPRLGVSISPSLDGKEWWVGIERKEEGREDLYDHGYTYPDIEKGFIGLANKLLGSEE